MGSLPLVATCTNLNEKLLSLNQYTFEVQIINDILHKLIRHFHFSTVYYFGGHISHCCRISHDSQMAQMENRTEVTGFILLGLSSAPELQSLLCIMFTVIYLVTLVGNLGMITLILLDSHLHTPMYFFLSNLSLVDFGSHSESHGWVTYRRQVHLLQCMCCSDVLLCRLCHCGKLSFGLNGLWSLCSCVQTSALYHNYDD